MTFIPNQVYAPYGSENTDPFTAVGAHVELHNKDYPPNARNPTFVQSLSLKAFNGDITESEIKGLRFYILLEEYPHRFRFVSLISIQVLIIFTIPFP